MLALQESVEVIGAAARARLGEGAGVMMDHAPFGALQNEDVRGCEVRGLIGGRLVAVDNRGIAKELNARLLARELDAGLVLQDVSPRAEHGIATQQQGLARMEARDRGVLCPKRVHTREIPIAEGSIESRIGRQDLALGLFSVRHACSSLARLAERFAQLRQAPRALKSLGASFAALFVGGLQKRSLIAEANGAAPGRIGGPK